MNFIYLTLLAVAASADFPLDQEMKSNFSGGDGADIEMICKVTKVGESYTYLYSIKNNGKKPIKFKCDVLDKAMQHGVGVDTIHDLEPGENLNFVLEHPDPPKNAWGKATAFYLTSKADFEKMIQNVPEAPKNQKISVPNKNFYLSITMGVNIALPESFVNNPYFRVK